jgi:SAM-dependent methyltransferase
VSPEVDAALLASAAPWFRARTCHEYGVVRAAAKDRVDMDRASILDFGCGALPVASAAFALRHPGAQVRGCDIEPIQLDVVRSALREQAGLDVPANWQAVQCAPNALPPGWGGVDLAYSWSVFEHIPAADVARNLALVRGSLGPGGIFFFQIGGLYFNTEGSHLKHLFPDEPWHHLTRSLAELEQHVFATPHPQVSKQRNWTQFMELNRLTADDYLDAASDAGLDCLWSSTVRDETTPVPPRLLRAYSRDALTTVELRALFTAKAGA